MTFHDFFERQGHPQATAFALVAAGFTTGQIVAAVRSGRLRQGVTGYWLPAPMDPGASRVMRRALREAHAAEGGAL